MIEEIEIKFAVPSKEALTKLEQRASEIFSGHMVKQVEQTNFFFDTPEFIVRKKGVGLRLRKQDEHYFMTVKGPNTGKDSNAQKLTSRLEFESEIMADVAKELLEGRRDPISVVEGLPVDDGKMRNTREHLLSIVKATAPREKLVMVGSFKNRRRMLPISVNGCGMKLEFDETRFLETVIHYEVELEIPSMEHFKAAEDFLIDLFNQVGIKPGYQKSKSERFYSLLRASRHI